MENNIKVNTFQVHLNFKCRDCNQNFSYKIKKFVLTKNMIRCLIPVETKAFIGKY